MENLQNHKLLYNNSQKQSNSQNHQQESMESITEEYLSIMNKFSQEIFQTNHNNKEKNEKKSEKLKNIPTFTNLLQRTQLDR
ncbi:unnamed protein product (macronuclear) [Paramecium tetraurelia]|uniref:Uncharacterized protein n=1 Tax=Paramecium tetraurelia TaxID=5888 RepID=A0DQ74_PARTE|nr:uncharacterized protein GSPATT00002591001 [Paramecium tetraurelia]CAK85191.1 unnamed protein product [Paramecium tetraurelia]|eukprot:XP_001452588.1 hypothetical protein (macronuclear) [Paramecium tetraurelia strain d4-2]